MSELHFLRPYWLLLLPLVWWLVYRLWQGYRRQSGWQELVDDELLPYLLEKNSGSKQADSPGQGQWQGQDQRQGKTGQLLLVGLFVAWTLAVLALSGPSWQRLPQPVQASAQPLVVILDLSPSMQATDLKPDRMTHARHRLIDLLNARQEGQTGLVVYSGDAHVLVPLSDDNETILNLLPSLSPRMMPLYGSQIEAAVDLALGLIPAAQRRQAQLLLITDGVDESAVGVVQESVQSAGVPLSILGVGTEEGAPIPLDEGELARDVDNNIYLARLGGEQLQGLAESTGGRYQSLRFDGVDVTALSQQINHQQSLPDQTMTEVGNQEFDSWDDAGIWLVLCILPLALLAHRRGYVLVVLVLVLPLMQPQTSYAAEQETPSAWGNLFLNQQQKAQQAYTAGDYEQAQKLFSDPEWQAAADYKQGHYERAIKTLETVDTAQAHYNRGNALAQTGDLKAAMAAYDEALKKKPDMEDAAVNKQLVEQRLQQQQQQSANNESQSEQQNPGQGSEQQEGQSGQSGDQQRPQDSNQTAGQASDQATDKDSETPDAQRSAQNNQGQQNQNGTATEDSATESQQQQKAEQDETATAQTEQQVQQEPTSKAGEQQGQAQAQTGEPAPLTPEQEALQRWLRQLPDDPSGLLRRKFEYEYRQKMQAYQNGEWQPPKQQRW